MNEFLYITVPAVFAAAAFFDMKSGRIPNRLILFGLLAYFFCSIFSVLFSGVLPGAVSGGFGTDMLPARTGLSGTGNTGLLLSAFLCLLLPVFWRFRLIGGGDVKLFWLLMLYLPGWPGVFCFTLALLAALPAALYGLFLGINRVRMGGAAFLAVLVYGGLEVGLK